MSNTILTHQMIAREAAAMLVEEANFIKNINTGRSGDILETVNGYKKGGIVNIGVPPTPVTFSGATFAGGGSAPPSVETQVPLQLTTQEHVALTFTAQEKLLELTEFKKRFLRPSMQALISAVQGQLLNSFMVSIPNVVGTPGTLPATRLVYGLGRSKLNQHLCPMDERTALISSDANANLADANATLFHAGREIENQYLTGNIGEFAKFEFYENESLPTITNGAGASYAVNGATQTGTSLTVKTGTGALNQGQIFTIAGVYAVHPITGVATPVLRQFVVAANYAGGAGNVSIYPAITPTTSTVVGTVNASPADSAAITLVGAASTSYRQDLLFQKDSFAAAFAPLPVLASCEGYTATVQNVSVRVMTFGNGYLDQENTRIDVLFGWATVRPDHAVRVTE
jgi:P22 coat protein - gene protein 5